MSKKLSLAVAFFASVPVLLPLSQAFADSPNWCERWLIAPISDAKKSVASSWRTFRSEVAEQGPRRLVFAPRVDAEKFNGWAAFIDPVLDLPTEVISRVRWKYLKRSPLQRRFSMVTGLPVGIVAWGLLFNGLNAATESVQVATIEQALNSQWVGSQAVYEWLMSGELSVAAAAHLVVAHKRDLEMSLKPLRDRAEQFYTLGVWQKSQRDGLIRAVERLIRQHSPAELLKHSQLIQHLEKDLDFAQLKTSLPRDHQWSVDLLLDPEVQVLGKSDVEWLQRLYADSSPESSMADAARAKLQLLSLSQRAGQTLSWITLAHLAARTLGDPTAMAEKKVKAENLGLIDLGDFWRRADLPLFAQTTYALNDELDRWNVLMHDPRFDQFKRLWQAGKLTDLQVLVLVERQYSALTNLSELEKEIGSGNPIDETSACRLVYGSDDTAGNSLFSSLKVDAQIISPGDLQLIELYRHTFRLMSEAPTAVAVAALLHQARVDEQKIVRQLADGQTQAAGNVKFRCSTNSP